MGIKIGGFDSGKGGLTIFDVIRERLPDEEYYYIADSENCPYGEKTDEKLYEIVRGNVERLIGWGARVIVVACNTATTRCIDRLRKDYPEIVFIGTEPAIKKALEMNAKKVLILATPGTVESERVRKMAQENEDRIDLKACKGLAETIEKHYERDDSKIEEKLKELFVVSPEYEVVVLGCTHYPLIKNKIQKYFPNAVLIDSIEGVTRRVEEVVKELKDEL